VEVLGPLRPDGTIPFHLLPSASASKLTSRVRDDALAVCVCVVCAQTRALASRRSSGRRCRPRRLTRSIPRSESSAPSATSSRDATRRANPLTRSVPSLSS
jgi:hypothetical protein